MKCNKVVKLFYEGHSINNIVKIIAIKNKMLSIEEIQNIVERILLKDYLKKYGGRKYV